MNKLLFLCFLVLAPVSLASADLKIAVIDLGKAFDSYYKTQDAQARIKEKTDLFQKDYEDLVATYNHLGQEAQALKDASTDATLSADARSDKSKALQAKAQDLQSMQRKIEEMKVERQREIQDEIMRRHQEIVGEITKVINDYSGPQGFDLVLDKSSASGTSGVHYLLYSSSKLTDITADIIKTLNANRPAGSAAAPASAPAATAPAPATPPAH
jgi:Skp family chaperone for outer membrane proteins